MRCLNFERTIRRGQEEIRAEDKVQKGKVQDRRVEIHQPRRGIPKFKEVIDPMSYRHVQLVRGSIGASVVREARLAMGVAKKGTRLEIVQ